MKILVVDDSSTARLRIRKELESDGHEVFEADRGESAIEMLATIRPELVTLDIDMPGFDGFETCRRIRDGIGINGHSREELSAVPIVFITANDTLRYRQKGYQVGGNEFMSKPFLRGELSMAVDRARTAHDNLRGHTVLVVDDSKAVRTLLTIGLKAKGLKVIEAKDGLKAFEILERDDDAIDVVITDFFMPGLNGNELCLRIREKLGLRELPIIFLSTLAEKESILKMFRAGASDFIVKPFSMEEVRARVSVHLNSKILGDNLRSNVSELKKAHVMKDKFLSICSHDLRAPLSGILGYADLMIDDETLEAENHHFVKEIQASGEFLLSMINDILELGRLQSDETRLESKPYNLLDVIDTCIQSLKHMAAPKEIRLNVESSAQNDEDNQVLGDGNALKRIVNNLVSNSIKFSHHGKDVLVKLSPDKERGILSLSIQDEGIGIPDGKVLGVFDPSSRTSQVGTEGEQSFGLGLPIVKQLVEQHRGKISILSKEGQGTTVTVEFPLDRNVGT